MTMADMDSHSGTNEDHTPVKRFRVPDALWEAYGSVCARTFGRGRSEDLVQHMRATVLTHGTPAERELLARADEEAAARRSRKGGRPRKAR